MSFLDNQENTDNMAALQEHEAGFNMVYNISYHMDINELPTLQLSTHTHEKVLDLKLYKHMIKELGRDQSLIIAQNGMERLKIAKDRHDNLSIRNISTSSICESDIVALSGPLFPTKANNLPQLITHHLPAIRQNKQRQKY